jgi:hypothetical protein
MLDNVPLRYIMYLKETSKLKTHFFEQHTTGRAFYCGEGNSRRPP